MNRTGGTVRELEDCWKQQNQSFCAVQCVRLGAQNRPKRLFLPESPVHPCHTLHVARYSTFKVGQSREQDSNVYTRLPVAVSEDALTTATPMMLYHHTLADSFRVLPLRLLSPWSRQ